MAQFILETISTIFEKLWDLFDIILNYPKKLLIWIILFISDLLNKIFSTLLYIINTVYHSNIFKTIKHTIKDILKITWKIITYIFKKLYKLIIGILEFIVAIINGISLIWGIVYRYVK